MTEDPRARADWEALQRDYEAGVLNLGQLSAKHGVSKQRISAVAKRDGWTRALKERIAARTERVIAKAALTPAQQEQKVVADEVVVAANAEMQANIVIQHRASIGRGRRLVDALFERLGIVVEHDDLIEILADTVSQELDDNPKQKAARMNALQAVLALPEQANVMLKLSTALKTLIGVEREAFGIQQQEEKQTRYEDGLEALAEGNGG